MSPVALTIWFARPARPPEEELFQGIVGGFWHLCQLRQVQAAVMAEELRGQRWRTACSGNGEEPRPYGIDREAIELGAAFQAACYALGQLDRYETSILRRTKQALAELQAMREVREEEAAWEENEASEVVPTCAISK